VAKLSPHAFMRFWDLHAWAGVVGGLVLHIMFLTGGISLFRGQLETWGEPLAQGGTRHGSLQQEMDRGLAALGRTPADFWFHPPKDGHGAARLTYQVPGEADRTRAWIDPERHRVVPEREPLSDFIYGLHYLWHDATGDWPYYGAGFLSVALLVVLVTGVLIHLKDIVRQFHQFRPEKSRRVLWSDMHKVLGVMGLPFQITYAYTGAFLVLGGLVLQGFVGPVFGGDEERAESVAWGAPERTKAKAGPVTAVLTLDELVARARSARPGVVLEPYRLRNHGHANGHFEAWGDEGTPSASVAVRLRETDGGVLGVQDYGEGASGGARRWINSLHYAYFGGPAIRFLFFVLALATCGTILTGNWVWLARRDARRGSWGNRLLSRLTAGVGAGTFVALAALFVASRLLPLELVGRGTIEELVFVATLLACIAWSIVSKNERRLWWQQLAVAGALLLAVPPLAARWSSAGLFGAGPRIAAVAGVDVGLLVTACVLCGTAAALRARSPRDA
jgi:uncharacterized iron-regulated membrane protein